MGCGMAENAEGFRAGRTAFREVTLFDTERQRTTTAGEAEMPEAPDLPGLPKKVWDRMDRGTRLALVAAHEALTEAGVTAACRR